MSKLDDAKERPDHSDQKYNPKLAAAIEQARPQPGTCKCLRKGRQFVANGLIICEMCDKPLPTIPTSAPAPERTPPQRHNFERRYHPSSLIDGLYCDVCGKTFDKGNHVQLHSDFAPTLQVQITNDMRFKAGQFMLSKELHTKSNPVPVATIQDWLEEFGHLTNARAVAVPEPARDWDEPCNQCGGFGGHAEGCTGHRSDLEAFVERLMKLPYIKATRNTETGEERFIAREDAIRIVLESTCNGCVGDTRICPNCGRGPKSVAQIRCPGCQQFTPLPEDRTLDFSVTCQSCNRTFKVRTQQ